MDMLWGYFFSALAIAALVGALVLYERDRARAAGSTLWPPLLGLLSRPGSSPGRGRSCSGSWWERSWSCCCVRRRGAASVAPGHRTCACSSRLLVPLVVAVAIPLGYYVVLGRVDPAWAIDPGVHDFLDPPWWAIGVTIAPLALPALLAYRRLPTNFHEAALRVWPVAALALYWLLTNAYPGHYAPHALTGLSIPLAVLAVTGVASLRPEACSRPRRARRGGRAVAVLTVPATVDRLQRGAGTASTTTRGPYFLTPGRARRVRLPRPARHPRGGARPGVDGPARARPGPAATRASGTCSGRPTTCAGASTRTCCSRAGSPRWRARAIARSSHARFLLAGCRGTTDLTEVLGAGLADVRKHFGCATVYELKA